MGPIVRRLGAFIGVGRRGSATSLLTDAEQIASAGSFECDLASGQVHCSTGLHRILASGPDREIKSETLLALVHPDDRAATQQALRRAAESGTPFSLELRIARFDGAFRTLRARGMTLEAAGSGRGKLIGTVQDVTEEVKARSTRDLLSCVIESSADAITTLAADGTITSWNRAAQRLYGYSVEEAVGSSPAVQEPPQRAGEHVELVRRAFAGESFDLDTERVRKDGSVIAVSLSVSPVRDAGGTVIAAASVARDLSARAAYELRLRHISDHDQLTGLLNRHRLDQEIRHELARAAREGDGGTLLVLDIDRFKAINDSHGHAVGDSVLAHVATLIRRRLRGSDVVGRLGGDELAVLLPGTGAIEARALAEELRETVEAARMNLGEQRLRITLSVGVAPFQGAEITADELLIHADLAVYAAKAGGDRVVVYSPEQGRIARSLAREPWSERIREALEEDSFVLHLQPIVELSSGTVSHGELLLRMQDRDGELIAPGAFLPTAERVGLIHQVDRWVVKRAIELIAAFPSHELPPVSVNLSGDTVVGDPQMLELIRRHLERTGADPSRLIFEITETTAIANMPDAITFTRALIEMGCSLALDDFGSGFASFKYLKHLPVRFVKLDGEFIQNLPRSTIDEHVVRTIVGLARSLGIKTVAEAVGDDETIELLRTHAVDFAQGFHLGVPEPLPSAV